MKIIYIIILHGKNNFAEKFEILIGYESEK